MLLSTRCRDSNQDWHRPLSTVLQREKIQESLRLGNAARYISRLCDPRKTVSRLIDMVRLKTDVITLADLTTFAAVILISLLSCESSVSFEILIFNVSTLALTKIQ